VNQTKILDTKSPGHFAAVSRLAYSFFMMIIARLFKLPCIFKFRILHVPNKVENGTIFRESLFSFLSFCILIYIQGKPCLPLSQPSYLEHDNQQGTKLRSSVNNLLQQAPGCGVCCLACTQKF
jgi:hypothetical protein